MRLNLKSVEERVRPLAGQASYNKDFIFDLLAAYGRTGGNITRLRNGSLNVAEFPESEVAQKNVVYFKPTTQDLYSVIDELKTSPHVVRYSTRFVIVTNYEELLAVDTKTGETLAININEIDQHFAFFLPWAGMEKAQYVGEKHADVKAAEQMASLFDEIVAFNKEAHPDREYWHGLNVFFTRLLFCYFAEDTDIFEEGLFTDAIGSFTQEDGSDLHDFFEQLFEVLDSQERHNTPTYLKSFPYVNGRLFSKSYPIPRFNKKSRDLLIESGRLLWNEINPDIFGSMFQAVITPGQRANLGMHYTSVPNIMKTIEPMFLDEIKDQLNKDFDDEKKLNELLKRISNIRVFDPACGSGNFLIIAYKELRKVEHTILERLKELRGDGRQELLGSRINIDHFYGIEIDDFAVEIAILSLWIAKHQMNVEFKEKFGIDLPLIPLKEAGQIVQGNATRIDWKKVCPLNENDEVYLIGNPPYKGSRTQEPEQKADLKLLTSKYKSLDYVSAWFIKGANYIRGTKAQLAFVSTNSVTQGEQVGILWPQVLGNDLEIGYAYTSFKWSNQAKNTAGVTCVIVNLQTKNSHTKFLNTEEIWYETDHINPYLAMTEDIFVARRSQPLSKFLPSITYGSMPNDGGNLILNEQEKNQLIELHPEASDLIRKFVGSDEFIKNKVRWCLVIDGSNLDTALSIPEIKDRLEKVRKHRLSSTEESTNKMAASPHRFYFFAHQDSNSIIIPSVSSERRFYIPIGYLDSSTVISNAANAIYDAEPYVFGLVTSRMHMVWMRAVAGQLETRIRYSATLVYNNFPIPTLSEEQTQLVQAKALSILDIREYHTEKSLGELYDPETMPDDLLKAHEELDLAVDGIYREASFENDEERLSFLFKLYKQMDDSERGTLI